jgi:hypothetical protein
MVLEVSTPSSLGGIQIGELSGTYQYLCGPTIPFVLWRSAWLSLCTILCLDVSLFTTSAVKWVPLSVWIALGGPYSPIHSARALTTCWNTRIEHPGLILDNHSFILIHLSLLQLLLLIYSLFILLSLILSYYIILYRFSYTTSSADSELTVLSQINPLKSSFKVKIAFFSAFVKVVGE